jgi:ABC-type dipeptide/oligopeptide/nickel transport system permease component
MTTAQFIARRAVTAALVLLAISVLCFTLLDLAPGDPARAVLEARSGGLPASVAEVADQRALMGLDDPLAQRYLRWAGGAATGDLGASSITGRPVTAELADTVPWTVLLTVVATVFSVLGAVAVGLVAGLTKRRWLRRGIELAMFVLGGMPGFVTALLLLYLGAARWQLLPSGGVGRPGEDVTVAVVAAHLVLPAAALAFGHHFGSYVRLIQTGITGVRAAPHVDNARARGLGAWTILRRHVLGPALVPFATRLGVGTGALLAGAYAIEVIFSWPGMGRLAIAAAKAQDYPVLTAVVLVTAAFVIAANLLGELAVSRLDPRVRLPGGTRRGPVVVGDH